MRRFQILAAAALLGFPTIACAQDAAPAAFNLSCPGRGAFVIPNLEKDEQGHYKSDKRVQTEGRTRVRVNGEAVSVRLPSTMPGGDTWLNASKVEIDGDHISGQVRTGLVGVAKFRIDRRTGDIDVAGSVRFDGTCEKAPDESAPAKF